MKRRAIATIGWGLVLLFVIAIGISAPGFAEEMAPLQTVTLKIDGMDCGACAKNIQSALAKTPGVKTAQVKVAKQWIFFNDYSNVRAVVEYESGKTDVPDLIKAVEGASNAVLQYKAMLAE